jgi:hypothetical protein
MLGAMASVVEPHLSNLTIGLQDLEFEDDIGQAMITLNPHEFQQFTFAVQTEPNLDSLVVLFD